VNATPAPTDWQSANQAYLVTSIERVELSLRKLSPNSALPGDDTDLDRVTRTLQELQQELPSPSARVKWRGYRTRPFLVRTPHPQDPSRVRIFTS